MKGKLFLAAVVLAVLILDVSAQKKKVRKIRKHRSTTEAPMVTDDNYVTENEYVTDDGYNALLRANREKIQEEKFQESQRQRMRESENEIFEDACSKVFCSAGRVCELDKDGEAECVCIKQCPEESDFRRKVCTNHNETWASDCEVHRHRCMCMTNQEECRGDKYNHIQVDYFGECREMHECPPDEMADFPRRMRDWLFNIMRDLADRRELSDHYMKMEHEAETNLTRRWTNAAIWKWCDLDADDNDRSVSRHELFPIRAPLMSMEHCIGPFLNSCDSNDDHHITLVEWGKCLELEEDDLEDKCDMINENNL